jgi:hypothetical protein
MDFALSLKDSMINYLEDKNLTVIQYNMKEYQNGTWVETPKELDLTGLIDVVVTLLIIFLPFIPLIRVVL